MFKIPFTLTLLLLLFTLVWNDIRTDSTVDIILAKVPDNNTNHFKSNCGLPISPYFSAFKLKWMMYYVPQVRKAIKFKRCLFGTVDTWLLWVSAL